MLSTCLPFSFINISNPHMVIFNYRPILTAKDVANSVNNPGTKSLNCDLGNGDNHPQLIKPHIHLIKNINITGFIPGR
jgi:hypothetical protein